MARPSAPLCESTLAGLPEPLLVGVSGGVDSVALLHALVRSGRTPVVLHFDHAWRPESGTDARWVRDLARRLGLKFLGGKSRSAGPKKEAQARTARYACFSRVARKLGTPHLVLAHQADDQVETFLLQLLRGTGSAGRGMDPLATRAGLVLHRPWLGVWKHEILAYARALKLTWREDSTNADTAHRRNLIRHRVLPWLRQEISPQVGENLWRAAEIARAESEWLDTLCRKAAAAPELSVHTLRAAPVARQRRTILRWLQNRGVHEIGFEVVESVRRLLENNVPAKVNLSAGKFARRRAGRIFVEGV